MLKDQLHLSLTDLEQHDWGEPSFGSYVVTQCHALRKKHLMDLSHEEIRLAFGQQIGLPYLIPLAFAVLREDPLIGVTFYDGDLFQVVMSVEAGFWSQNPDLWQQALDISEEFWRLAAADSTRLGRQEEDIRAKYAKYDAFLDNCPPKRRKKGRR